MTALDSEPSAWALDELGAPRWIVSVRFAHVCEWVPLVPPAGTEALTSGWRKPWPAGVRELPAGAMPTLDGLVERPQERRRGPGNPGLAETAPHEARAAAWLRDLRAYSLPRIAKALFAPCGGDHRGERSPRRQAERHVNAGRALLHRERVLPWCLFSNGSVEGDWWDSPRFRTALDLWYLRSVRSAPLASQREQVRISHGRLVLLDMFERGLPPPPILLGPSHPRNADEAALRLGRSAAMLGRPELRAVSR